jgi:predicted SAM-dependent methyltransferase
MGTLEKLIESGLCKRDGSVKLHLGCGGTRLDGYINIDFPQDKHNVMLSAADAEADIINDLSFQKEAVDEIRSHHMFEHFSRVIALAQLVKWHCWLKVDGTLIIETPDFMRSVTQLANELTDYTQKMAIVRHLVGDQAASWGFHVDQWWSHRFETTLSCLNFHIIDIEYLEWDRWPHLRSIKVTATKLSDVPIRKQITTCLDLLQQSMVSPKEEKTFQVWKKQLHKALKGVC